MAPKLTSIFPFFSVSKRNRERKSENDNQGCLENHKIRVACLEKHVRDDICMLTSMCMFLNLKSAYLNLKSMYVQACMKIVKAGPPKSFFFNFHFLWIYINMQKIKLFHWFVLKVWFIKKPCHFTEWEQFLKNNFFSKYGTCAGT